MDLRQSRRAILRAIGASLLTPRLAGAAPLSRFTPARAGQGTFDHSALGRLLERYVRGSPDGINRVDYRAWKAAVADVAALDDYLRKVQSETPSRLTRAEQFAYWANLYNAETLRVVLAAYPVRSILLVRPSFFSIEPWKARTMTIDGERLSLDEIENAILRPLFGDVRVHYALNCASLGCPNLRQETWRGATLERDLDAAAAAYVNHPRGVRIVDRGLRLSSICRWYRPDFGGSDAAIVAHLWRYAHPPLLDRLAAGVPIEGYGYDWSLNDKPAKV